MNFKKSYKIYKKGSWQKVGNVKLEIRKNWQIKYNGNLDSDWCPRDSINSMNKYQNPQFIWHFVWFLQGVITKVWLVEDSRIFITFGSWFIIKYNKISITTEDKNYICPKLNEDQIFMPDYIIQ